MITLDPLEMKALCASKLFSGYSALALTILLEEMEVRRQTFVNNQVVVSEGDPVTKMGVILSGGVYLCRSTLSGGGQRICSLLSAGDVAGATMIGSARRQYPATLIGHGSGSYAAFPLDRVRALQKAGREVRFFTNLSNYLSEQLLESWQTCSILSYPNIAERVLAYLRCCARKTGSNEVRIPSTEEAFANYLGVNRAALSRVFGRLKRDGKIAYRKNVFTLMDGAMVEKLK